jgi:hypothetical protein|tara:strand:- start:370 stop:576 length:207 start_codon:yes stop_codon:yes gene_type:complete
MKIEINILDNTGIDIVAKAIETSCDSLIINGMRVIANGQIQSEMRYLEDDEIPVSVEQYTGQRRLLDN